MPATNNEPLEKEECSQAAPPAESEEDRLVRVGIVMDLVWDGSEGTTTKEQAESFIKEYANRNLEVHSPEQRSHYLELGKQDPRPFMERLKQSCQNLLVLCQNQEEQKRLVKQMQSTLADLELVLLVRRYGGRPKGTRKKVTPDVIEKIRQWNEAGGVKNSSVKDLAKNLKLSRQTVYTILEEIKAEADKTQDNPAVADEPS